MCAFETLSNAQERVTYDWYTRRSFGDTGAGRNANDETGESVKDIKARRSLGGPSFACAS